MSLTPPRSRGTYFTLLCAFAGAFGCGVPMEEEPVAQKADALRFSTLRPGTPMQITENLSVNVVFIGYERGRGPRDVDPARFLSTLPKENSNLVRSPLAYGLTEPVGQRWKYKYHLTFANRHFEDDFFRHLKGLSRSAPLTAAQTVYNTQVARSLSIAENNTIEAPSVERWLAQNAGRIGVDTAKYTIFFVNWHGRSDFKHHVYTKTDEPDPDTGYNFGEQRGSRKIIAWGGTATDDPQGGPRSAKRLWFYDLSAGPEVWTANYDLDNGDLDGNGVIDYRMPPVWEYGNRSAYRPFDDLSGDLGKVARYVAINLLFTTSPIYDPGLPADTLPETVQVDLNLYQGEPGFDARSVVAGRLLQEKLQALRAESRLSLETTSQPFGADIRRVYECWLTGLSGMGTSCYGDRMGGIAFADLFLYHSDNLARFLEGDANYEAPTFAFATPDELDNGGLLGFADDNWMDGKASYVYSFVSPGIREAGYGLTTTTIHEVGHHLGLSHPHDGFDGESGTDYGPGDEFYFAWSGDESNSIMSYIDLNWDFSQFDRDNMNRYMTTTYLTRTNGILPKILAHPRAHLVLPILTGADRLAGEAVSDYKDMAYPAAMFRAKGAYLAVRFAAHLLRISIDPPVARRVAPRRIPNPRTIDALDAHRNAP